MVLDLETLGLTADLFAHDHEVIPVFQEERGVIPRTFEFVFLKSLQRLGFPTLEVHQSDAVRLNPAELRECLLSVLTVV